MIKNLYRLLLTVLFFPLSLLKRKNIMLFYSDFDYADSTQFVFEETVKQGHRAYYLSKTGNLDKIPNEFKQYVLEVTSIKAAFYLSRGKVLFLTHGFGQLPLLFFGLKVIQFWHGVPFKKILLDSEFDTKKFHSNFLNHIYIKLYKKRINLYDYIVSTGERTSQIFSNSFGVSAGRVLNFGSPRHQKMAEFKIAPRAIKKVIYLPTWRDDRTVLGNTCEKILSADFQAQLCEENIQLDISFHPFDQVFFSNYFNQNPNVLKSTFNIYEQFNEYDAFIVDYSSVAFDLSTITDNVLFLLPDIKQYQSERDLYVDISEVAGELCATNQVELLELLREIKNNTNLYNNIKKLKFVEKNDNPIQKIIHFVETKIFE
ncbi:CDP-glycerol glycerophosphotransferase family protein [Pseudoalteromonas nigrifaciens]|uniref:CDP-glycerol glycerophosphotransferase family protein n=1 Tax=Pseudoalteromonas nigrifaciens TaxID=28109 RepID=UPI001CE4AE2F|nr:CDP-glycerol glycerophosphotransferase family protein [Pseudoalteromonas nigrifaciens]